MVSYVDQELTQSAELRGGPMTRHLIRALLDLCTELQSCVEALATNIGVAINKSLVSSCTPSVASPLLPPPLSDRPYYPPTLDLFSPSSPSLHLGHPTQPPSRSAPRLPQPPLPTPLNRAEQEQQQLGVDIQGKKRKFRRTQQVDPGVKRSPFALPFREVTDTNPDSLASPFSYGGKSQPSNTRSASFSGPIFACGTQTQVSITDRCSISSSHDAFPQQITAHGSPVSTVTTTTTSTTTTLPLNSPLEESSDGTMGRQSPRSPTSSPPNSPSPKQYKPRSRSGVNWTFSSTTVPPRKVPFVCLFVFGSPSSQFLCPKLCSLQLEH
jgi:hypothetical protein